MTSASYILVSAADAEPNKTSTAAAAGSSTSTTATATAATATSTSKTTQASLGLGLPLSLPFGPRKRTSSFSFSVNNTGEPLRKYQKKMATSTATLTSMTNSTSTTTTTTLTMVASPEPLAPSGGLRRCASYASLNTLATYSPQASSSSTTTTVTEVPYKRSLRYQLDQRNRRRTIASKLTSGGPCSSPSMLTFPSSSSTSTEEFPPPPPAPAPPALQDHAIPLKVKCKVSRKALPPIQIPIPTRPAPPPPISPSSKCGPQPTPIIRHHSPPPPPCLPLPRPLSPLCPTGYTPSAKQGGPCSAFFATFPNPRRPRSRPEANWVKVALCTRLRRSEEGRRILRVGPRKALSMGLLKEQSQDEVMLMDFDRAWREGEALRQSLGMCSSSGNDSGMNAAMGYEYGMGYGGGFDLTEATRELEELVRDQDRQIEELGLFDMDVDEDVVEDVQQASGIREEQLASPYLSPAYSVSSTSLTLAELNFAPSSECSPSSSLEMALTCPPSPALTFASSDSFDSSSDDDEEEDKDAEGEPDPDVFMFDAPAWPASFAKLTPKTSYLSTPSKLSNSNSGLKPAKSNSGPTAAALRMAKRKPVALSAVQEEEEREGWNLIAYPFPSMAMSMSMMGCDAATATSGWEVIERSQAVLEACA